MVSRLARRPRDVPATCATRRTSRHVPGRPSARCLAMRGLTHLFLRYSSVDIVYCITSARMITDTAAAPPPGSRERMTVAMISLAPTLAFPSRSYQARYAVNAMVKRQKAAKHGRPHPGGTLHIGSLLLFLGWCSGDASRLSSVIADVIYYSARGVCAPLRRGSEMRAHPSGVPTASVVAQADGVH